MKGLCNDNTKRPKPQDIQLSVSKIYAICQIIQQGDSGPRESAAGVTCLLESTQKANFEIHLPPKSCHNFSGSRKGAAEA